jgi:hypothetical protein
VYSREIDDSILTMSASGWTYDFTFILYDYNTESMWLPVNIGQAAGEGTCGCVLWGIAGHFAGRLMPAIPTSENTTWSLWYNSNPTTKLMIDNTK